MPILVKSLKCDAPKCNHTEDIDSFHEGLVGKPCPKCGESLLTQADWDAVQALNDLANTIEEFFPSPEGEELHEVKLNLSLNGTGKFTYIGDDIEN